MDALVERFSDPEAAQVTLRVRAGLTDGLRMNVDIRKHRLTVDEPKAFGGTDEGPNPIELVLAALTTCQAITYRVWADKLGIALDAVDVQAEGDIDLRGFLGIGDGIRAGYSAVRLTVTLDGPESSARYRELAEAVDGHCPVLDFAGNAIPVERTLIEG